MTGSKVERVLQLAGITADKKNSISGETSAINTGRVRLGMPALTARGLDARHFDAVAEFLHRGCDLVAARREKEKGGLTGSGDIGGVIDRDIGGGVIDRWRRLKPTLTYVFRMSSPEPIQIQACCS